MMSLRVIIFIFAQIIINCPVLLFGCSVLPEKRCLMNKNTFLKHIPWVILGIIGAFCLSVVALRRGEHVSALWIVVASVAVYLVAYRYYSLYIAQK